MYQFGAMNWAPSAKPVQCPHHHTAWRRQCGLAGPCRQRHKGRLQAASLPPPDQGSSSQGPEGQGAPWYDDLNRFNLQAPPMSSDIQPGPIYAPMGPSIMGEQGFKTWQEVKRSERQRVWDSMRAAAKERYERGEMPPWFDPRWLAQEESPVNQILREMGDQAYQYDDSWLGRPFEEMEDQPALEAGGGGDDAGGSNRRPGEGGGGGSEEWWWSWWRNDDPFWMLRDWGSHPMRWWTLAYAAILALGGLGAFVLHQSPESLFIGWGSAACLAICSLAMSDMRTEVYGELAVKAAFGICALLALKDGIWGWAHLPHSGTQHYDYNKPTAFLKSMTERAPWEWAILRPPEVNLSAMGWSAITMCVFLMWGGMNGEVDGSLPVNPGGVYKSGDIAFKHRVWKRWGYADEAMRV